MAPRWRSGRHSLLAYSDWGPAVFRTTKFVALLLSSSLILLGLGQSAASAEEPTPPSSVWQGALDSVLAAGELDAASFISTPSPLPPVPPDLPVVSATRTPFQVSLAEADAFRTTLISRIDAALLSSEPMASGDPTVDEYLHGVHEYVETPAFAVTAGELRALLLQPAASAGLLEQLRRVGQTGAVPKSTLALDSPQSIVLVSMMLVDPTVTIAILIELIVGTATLAACATGPVGCSGAAIVDGYLHFLFPSLFAAWYVSGGLACQSQMREYAGSNWYEGRGYTNCSPVNYYDLWIQIKLFRDGQNVWTANSPNCGAVAYCEYTTRMSPAKPDAMLHCFAAVMAVFVYYPSSGWVENRSGAAAPTTAPLCF